MPCRWPSRRGEGQPRSREEGGALGRHDGPPPRVRGGGHGIAARPPSRAPSGGVTLLALGCHRSAIAMGPGRERTGVGGVHAGGCGKNGLPGSCEQKKDRGRGCPAGGGAGKNELPGCDGCQGPMRQGPGVTVPVGNTSSGNPIEEGSMGRGGSMGTRYPTARGGMIWSTWGRVTRVDLRVIARRPHVIRITRPARPAAGRACLARLRYQRSAQ